MPLGHNHNWYIFCLNDTDLLLDEFQHELRTCLHVRVEELWLKSARSYLLVFLSMACVVRCHCRDSDWLARWRVLRASISVFLVWFNFWFLSMIRLGVSILVCLRIYWNRLYFVHSDIDCFTFLYLLLWELFIGAVVLISFRLLLVLECILLDIRRRPQKNALFDQRLY